MILSIFACAYWPFACFLWRNVYLGLLFIFQLSFLLLLLLSCMSCLYILQIKPLLATLSDKGSISEICNFYLHINPALSGYMPRSCWIYAQLDHMVIQFLVFLKSLHTVSIVGAIIYITTNSVRGFPFLYTLSCIHYL